MRRDDICIHVGPANRARLEAIITDRNSSNKAVWRAEFVLATADGLGTNTIMQCMGTSKTCVWRWQKRYVDEGVDGLRKVLAKTASEVPADATHWSVRLMATAMEIQPHERAANWAEAGLKPHLVRRFKISNDPQFEEKVTDNVGLYMNPPDKALVLGVDEKSQIQALDCTQAGLPMRMDRAGSMTHDYKRHGTTTLFAHLDIPLVLDQYGTHTTREVKAWLAKHRRFKPHFTPTNTFLT